MIIIFVILSCLRVFYIQFKGVKLFQGTWLYVSPSFTTNQPSAQLVLLALLLLINVNSHCKYNIFFVCSSPLAANYTNQYSTMFQFFQTLLPNYRALVYNGDADIMCNFLGDQKFVEELGQPVLSDRRAWIYNNQVAGFVKEYEHVTFMTVKNSGHMVPQTTPGPALHMITNFLRNKPQ